MGLAMDFGVGGAFRGVNVIHVHVRDDGDREEARDARGRRRHRNLVRLRSSLQLHRTRHGCVLACQCGALYAFAH